MEDEDGARRLGTGVVGLKGSYNKLIAVDGQEFAEEVVAEVIRKAAALVVTLEDVALEDVDRTFELSAW